MTKGKTNPEEKLKASMEILKKRVAKASASKSQKKEQVLRALRKSLKRVQRKQSRARTFTTEQQVQKVQKLQEALNKRADELKKQGKKAGDPYVRSISKKTKTLSRRLKALQQLTAATKPEQPAEKKEA
jgi:hypothetical protein